MAVARQSARSPDAVDRILAGVCAVIWLAVIGVGVAATVVLVDLGSGRHSRNGGDSHTPWLLYGVIGLSALIIIGAVPLLIRARRGVPAESSRAPVTPARAASRSGQTQSSQSSQRSGPSRPSGAEAPTQKLRVFGSIADPIDSAGRRAPAPPPGRLAGGLAEDAVQRLWLRATLVLAGAMGVAMLGVTAATYLMGVDKDNTAWVAYGVAAVVTVAMPVVPWRYLRQLRSTVGAKR
ncbi:MAG: DUF2561 family protein [Mycobacteriaceae bacterium]|nr:DUF2561 family protein [Mycobacteriaceae bacterium]